MSRRDTGRAASRRPVAVTIAAVLAVALPLFLATAVGAETGRLTAHLTTGRPAAPALNTQAWTSDGTPAVGALFTTSRSGALARHFCSAAVVDSPADDLLITAAHCLTGEGQVVFVPGYTGGRAPYGAWTVTRVVLAPQWTSSADPDDDVAFLLVSQPQTGVAIQRVTVASASASARRRPGRWWSPATRSAATPRSAAGTTHACSAQPSWCFAAAASPLAPAVARCSPTSTPAPGSVRSSA